MAVACFCAGGLGPFVPGPAGAWQTGITRPAATHGATATPTGGGLEQLLGIESWQSGRSGTDTGRSGNQGRAGTDMSRAGSPGSPSAGSAGEREDDGARGFGAAVWDDPREPPYSPQLSALLRGSSFSAGQSDGRPRPPGSDFRVHGTGWATSGPEGLGLTGGPTGSTINPLRSSGPLSSSVAPAAPVPSPAVGSRMVDPTAGLARAVGAGTGRSTQPAPPRTMPSSPAARPLVSANQRSQSLLNERGQLELIGHQTEDPLELPPPYEVATAGQPRAVARPDRPALPLSASPPADRPLAEVIQSPNLPIRSGFQTDDFDLDLEDQPEIRSQLAPEELATLAKQFATRRPAATPPTASQPVTELVGEALAEPAKMRSSDAREMASLDRPAAVALLDFAAMRRQFSWSVSPTDESVGRVLYEVDYWNQRRQFQAADERLRKIARVAKTQAERHEMTWQTIQVAIGLRDPQRLQMAVQQIPAGSVDSLSGTAHDLGFIYREYARGHLALLEPQPDHVTAADSFQTVLRNLAQQLPSLDEHDRQRSLLILLDSHCQMARCVAMGPYQQAPASADLWYEQAKQFAEEMIRTQQAAPLIRAWVAIHQIEGYAQAGRLREIPVPLSYMTTMEHQLRTQGQTDDSQWIHEQTTEVMLQAGLMALNYRQFAIARTWGQQSLARLQAGRGKREWRGSDQQALATSLWLLGAVAYQTQPLTAAQPWFAQAAQAWADPSHGMPVDPLGHGERMAIAAVALWQAEQKTAAIRLGQEAVQWIQTAIERGNAGPERIETPASNLQEMIVDLGPTDGESELALPITTLWEVPLELEEVDESVPRGSRREMQMALENSQLTLELEEETADSSPPVDKSVDKSMDKSIDAETRATSAPPTVRSPHRPNALRR